MMDRREQVIWAAGFFDGEGCISVGRSLKGKAYIYYTLQITVFQNERAPLEILHALFGGSLRRRQRGWIWNLAGQRTIHALAEMMPFFVVKRAQAQIAVVFQGRKAAKGGKYRDPVAAREEDHRDFIQMRELKLVREV